MPPWIIFDDFEEVPEAKSPFSTRAVRRPRLAASSATPAPVTPPPMTSTSNSSSARRRNASSRRNGCTGQACHIRSEAKSGRTGIRGVRLVGPTGPSGGSTAAVTRNVGCMLPAQGDPWAGYARTVVEIARPLGGDLVVRAAPPGEVGEWPWAEPGPVLLLTAWDPGDERPGEAVNRERQRALDAELRPLAAGMWPAVGIDPLSGRREEGVAVCGVRGGRRDRAGRPLPAGRPVRVDAECVDDRGVYGGAAPLVGVVDRAAPCARLDPSAYSVPVSPRRWA